MRKAMWLAFMLAVTAPASAQAPIFHDALDNEIVGTLPPAEEIEALAPVLDHMARSLFQIDVGPLMDAGDPWRRRPDHGVPGRTLGEMAARDDPYFEDRLSHSIYDVTSEIGRMMDLVAVTAPHVRRSLREFERGIEGAIDEYERRPPLSRERRPDRGY